MFLQQVSVFHCGRLACHPNYSPCMKRVYAACAQTLASVLPSVITLLSEIQNISRCGLLGGNVY